MRSVVAPVLGAAVALAPLAGPAPAPAPRSTVVFMEPLELSEKGALPAYREVTDASRLAVYGSWLQNESARMALELHERAVRAREGESRADTTVFIALRKGGNNADVGFRLVHGDAGTDEMRTPYLVLAPEDWAFGTTLLHEMGHVVLMTLNGGRRIPSVPQASISHSTAALTDRGTAFDEGFAIHLETLVAHLGDDPQTRERYDHRHFLFGLPRIQSEYYWQSSDLLTFSQTRSRYHEVRENAYAFAPAYRGPDYLRVQLEKSRDYAQLRDPNQLLQAEGFYASFFFGLMARGSEPLTPSLVQARQDDLLKDLTRMLRASPAAPDSPHLLRLVQTLLEVSPNRGREGLDVLMDLSHGAFVDRRAADLWRDHYLGALRLDMAERGNGKLEAARASWRTSTLRNPALLEALLGPQVRCEVPSRTVLLVAFEEPKVLSFDVNTVEEGIMRLVPEIAEAEVRSWAVQRAARPYRDGADFRARAGLGDRALSALRFPDRASDAASVRDGTGLGAPATACHPEGSPSSTVSAQRPAPAW